MKKKRLLSVLLAGAMLSGMAVPAQAEVETLTMLTYVDWYGSGLKAVEEYINENSEELGFKLEIESIPGGTEGDQLLAARTTTNDLPDILNGYTVDRFYNSSGGEGKLVSLGEVSSVSEYDESVVTSSLYMKDGEQLALPFGTAYYYGNYYNKTVLEEAGIDELPTNWEEYLEACEKVKAIGKTPVYISAADTWTVVLYACFGFQEEYAAMEMDANEFWLTVMNMNEKTFAECTYVKEAIEKTKELIDLGYVQETYLSDTYDMAQTALANGECAFYCCANTVISEIEAKYPEKLDDIGGTIVPLFDENEISMAMPTMLAVTTEAENQELAIEAVNFLCSSEAMDIYAAAQPGIYVNESMTVEQSGALVEQSEYPMEGAWDPKYADAAGASLVSGMIDYFLGSMTVDEVMETVDADIARSAEAAGDENWVE